MKKILSFFMMSILICLLTSLVVYHKSHTIVDRNTSSPLSKSSPVVVKSMKELRKVSPRTKIDFCDLSHQNLTRMPDFTKYKIRYLDLSHNDLREFDSRRLPKEVEFLNVSNCKIGYPYRGTLPITRNKTYVEPLLYVADTKLKELVCTHNRIEVINIPKTVVRLDASYNRLREIMVCLPEPPKKKPTDIKSGGNYTVENSLRYLNVSHNPDFDSIQRFNIETIDTIISTNAARGAKIRKSKSPFIFYFREE